jgi:histidinol dehydrogenase
VPLERLSCTAADAAAAAARLRARVPSGASVADAVAEIVQAIRDEGDRAVLRHEARFVGGEAPLRVSGTALGAALSALDRPVRSALELAHANVSTVARAGLAGDRDVELPQGQVVRLREVPVRRAAVYAPGGQAPYPSTVVMGVATAQAAGVREIVVCASHPVMLAACALCGVDEVYRMGGAQAIAALAFGTETVAPVDVIVGPGSLYAQEAKRQVFGQVGIDGFAGPSDLVIVASPGADAEAVALDALAQAEHGAGSAIAVVTPDGALLDAVATRAGDGGEAIVALVQADALETALAFAQAFAPEHLQLCGPEAEALAPLVTRAGCVFVGAAAGTAFGDYVAGSNHVLPTEGAARFASGLNVRHFVRVMAEVHIGAQAASELAAPGAAIARAEGFEAHAASMQARVRDNAAP